eukprot:UN31367
MACTYPRCVYKRDFYEFAVFNRSRLRFALLDHIYPLHEAIETNEEKMFQFFAIQHKAYDARMSETVWMTAIKNKIPMEKVSHQTRRKITIASDREPHCFGTYLKVTTKMLMPVDKRGFTFSHYLLGQNEMLYIAEVINHLVLRTVDVTEIFEKIFHQRNT